MTEENSPKVEAFKASDELPAKPTTSSPPTIWADGAVGFLSSNSVVKFNLYSVEQNLSTKQFERAIAARIVMDINETKAFAEWLLHNVAAHVAKSRESSDGSER